MYWSTQYFKVYGTKACLSGSIPKSFSIYKQYSWIQHQICSQQIYVNAECAIALENKQLRGKWKLTLMKQWRISMRELGSHNWKSHSETRSASTHASRNGKVSMKNKACFSEHGTPYADQCVALLQNPNPNLAAI